MNFSTVLSGVVSLIAVSAIFLLFIGLSRKLRLGSSFGPSSKYMKVLDKCFIGPNSHLLIAQVGNRYFLIGVSGSSISSLFELSQEDLLAIKKEDKSFKELLAGTKSGDFAWLKKSKKS